MWAHWAFKEPSSNLEQGDILRPSPEVVALLQLYHPHYASHPENRFYIVLTQSCDLVWRSDGIKARYIAIAPVRVLDAVMEREFSSSIIRLDDGSSFASTRTKTDLERFLGRLINNNEPGYFYIEPEATAGLTEPMCAALALPISFRAEHYSKFIDARVIGLEDSFQAKLGWLLGQMYSRVGTRDFPGEEVKAKVSSIVSELAIWLDPRQFDHVVSSFENERKEDNQKGFVLSDIERIGKTLPKKKDMAINIILDKAAELGIIPNPSTARRALRKGLESDSAFAQYFA